jgi:hypothetical protein
MVEGSETSGHGRAPDPAAGGPGSSGGSGGEGQRRHERDLLAERRARRAAESGEQSVARRAEAAEATVRTLEAHVASLQQRLRDELARERAETPARRPVPSGAAAAGGVGPAAGAEHARGGGGESPAERELRHARQREYAEQRQRVEAEERLAGLERDATTEVERLRRRLSESEAEAGMLAGRLEQLRRELAEAEQVLASERVALRRAESELQVRVAELDRRASARERELESERAARERAELALAATREGHRRLEALVAELKAASQRVRAAAEAAPEPTATVSPTTVSPAGVLRRPPAGSERTDEPSGGADPQAPLGSWPGGRPQPPPAAAPQAAVGEDVRATTAHSGEMVQALAAAVERLRARAAEEPQPAVTWPALHEPRHKHSMSLIGRWRAARKERQRR